jgi:hypothetical protein
MDKLWGARTTKNAPELIRFAEIICALPLATDAPAKAGPRKYTRKAPAPAEAPIPEPMTKDAIPQTPPWPDRLAVRRTQHPIHGPLRRNHMADFHVP